jgi:hypothetical protein
MFLPGATTDWGDGKYALPAGIEGTINQALDITGTAFRMAVCRCGCGIPSPKSSLTSRWKYAIGAELGDTGFDPSVLSKFRTRLADHKLERVAFDREGCHYSAYRTDLRLRAQGGVVSRVFGTP